MKNTFKKIYKATIILITILFVTSIINSAFAQGVDSILVKQKERFLRTRIVQNTLLRRGIRNVKMVNKNIYVIPEQKLRTLEEQIKDLKETSLFEIVEPNYKLVLDQVNEPLIPNDKNIKNQYYLNTINAIKAWEVAIGNEITVAVLDSGVEANHPDLVGKIIGKVESLVDRVGHGTEVSGIIAANTNNKIGIAGIARNTKILSIKITDENNEASVSSVLEAIEEAYKSGAKIIHISLSTDDFSSILQEAINEVQSKGILVIASSGNSGLNELRYPAAFDGVIAVGAIDENNEIASFSTTGKYLSLVAPGVDIYTTTLKSKYKKVSGTSFSAPQVTGAAALIWSLNPELTNNDIRKILLQNGDKFNASNQEKGSYTSLNIYKTIVNVDQNGN